MQQSNFFLALRAEFASFFSFVILLLLFLLVLGLGPVESAGLGIYKIVLLTIFLICFTRASARQKVLKLPVPCPSCKSVNYQEHLTAKTTCFSPRFARSPLLFPSAGVPQQPVEQSCSLAVLPLFVFFVGLGVFSAWGEQTTQFFPRASRGDSFCFPQ